MRGASMQYCPKCEIQFKDIRLENELPAHVCSGCEGVWIAANEYALWAVPIGSMTVDQVDFDQPFDTPYPINDSSKALICPDCSRILRRFQVWPNSDFHLDRCGKCHGIWFDQHEWETLSEMNLHTLLNLFFTESWQEKLRSEEMHRRFNKMYLELFGEEDYAEIQSVRSWLSDHPNGARLLAYLTDRDPYVG